MSKIQTEVLVIGGGATGIGILRDLAMRGFKAMLVEKGDLTHGTSGRYHGLLHSGGRYVVKDPHAAAECIQENRILRRIMPQCIEDTGGFFVLTPFDDPEYAGRFLQGCSQAGIPVEEIPVAQMLREEPLLNPAILRCFRLPDGSADSFAAAEANAASARACGAQILTYHKVTGLIQQNGTVCGAHLLDLAAGEEIEIYADMVVNAAGAWAGQIAAMAGLQVQIVPGKGVMLAANRRIVHTVINRCKMPSDGDILVPAHTVSVIGTTDVRVSDPDAYSIEAWEVDLLLHEGEKLIPGFKEMRMLRAWAGVRPLYQAGQADRSRDVTRAFVLLDHQTLDGAAGLLTITSGKWTTYRKMAQEAVDLVCQKLGVQRECRTHLEALPPAQKHGYHKLGQRLAEIEKNHAFGELVCECELATVQDVSQAILQGGAQTLDDIRRDTRLGMGPCQGGFCTYRAAGTLHQLRRPPVEHTNQALKDFLQERWKGLLPVLWGQQLRQERLDELIYLSILGVNQLPGVPQSVFSPAPYAPAADTALEQAGDKPAPEFQAEKDMRIPAAQTLPSTSGLDVLVIGMGLAGLAAAWKAARNGARVRLIAKGAGSLYFQPGCLDLLGIYPPGSDRTVEDPHVALLELIHDKPNHPYALAGMEQIEASLHAFQQFCQEQDYPMVGGIERNWLLPSAAGAARPTCLAPESMLAGDLKRKEPILVVGFNRYQDFYPEWIAANLEKLGIPAQGVRLDLETLQPYSFITSRVLADAFDRPGFAAEVAEAVQQRHTQPAPSGSAADWLSSSAGAAPASPGFRRHPAVPWQQKFSKFRPYRHPYPGCGCITCSKPASTRWAGRYSMPCR